MPEQPPTYDAGFPANRKHGGKHATAERHRQAVGLRQAGASYDQIAVALGYANRGGAFKAVTAALRRQEHESVADLRTLQGDRLDAALRAIWTRAVGGDLHAIDRVLAIEKRRAALFGLDAPTRTELTGKDGRPLQVEVRPVLDFSLLSDEELEHLAALAERLGIDPTAR